MNRMIIVVVGLTGGGKSEASDYIKSLGVPMFRTGDVVRAEVVKRGFELTPRNSELIARKLRQELGGDAPARITGELIKKNKDKLICVEGPRDMAEIAYLATLGSVLILVISASPEVRFERSKKRTATKLEPKTRDPNSYQEFLWRDEKEKERGQLEVMTTELYVRKEVKNSLGKEELHAKLKEIVDGLKKQVG